jgi:hypothetical protein
MSASLHYLQLRKLVRTLSTVGVYLADEHAHMANERRLPGLARTFRGRAILTRSVQ